MRRIVLIVLILLFSASIVNATWLPGYIFRKPLTVDHTKVASGNHFYVILTSSNFNFTDWNNHLGGYINFTTSDGSTEIPWCVETWDNTNQYAKIALMPTSISEVSDTTIYMYYGYFYTKSLDLGEPEFPSYVNSIYAFSNTNGWIDSASNPLLSPTGSEDILFPVEVMLDGSDYRMAYAARNASGKRIVKTATSSDGVSWTKDEDTIDLNGSPGAWDETIRCLSVWKEGSTYHCIYAGAGSNSVSGGKLGYAYTDQGLNGVWTKYAGNPVISDTAAWERTAGGSAQIEITAPIIKVGSTYYAFYNTYMCGEGNPERAIGIATSTNLTSWTKDANNPIFDGGRFCNMIWFNEDTNLYYTIVTHYTDGCDFSELELYSCPYITFYEEDRTFMGVVHAVGPTGTMYANDQDVPLILTNDVERRDLSLTGEEVWCYFSGQGTPGGVFAGGLFTCNIDLATIPPKNKGYDIVRKNANMIGAEKLTSAWREHDYLLQFDGVDDYLSLDGSYKPTVNAGTGYYESYLVEASTSTKAQQCIVYKDNERIYIDWPLVVAGNVYSGSNFRYENRFVSPANSAFYISFIVKPTSSVSTTQCIFSNRDADTGSAVIQIAIVSGQFFGQIRDDAGNNSSATVGPTLSVNGVYYVGIGRDTSGNCYLVIDGIKYSLGAARPGTITPDQENMHYGAHVYSLYPLGTQFFTGYLGKVEYLPSWPSDATLLSKSEAAHSDNSMKFYGYLKDTGANTSYGRFGPDIDFNTLYIVGIGRAANGTVYGVVNGDKYQIGSSSVAGDLASAASYIGRNGSSGNIYFKGYLGGMETYTKFPSDDEIDHFYYSLTNGMLTYGTATEGGIKRNSRSVYRTSKINGIPTSTIKSINGVQIQ
jgi:hypothetical protein